jgi:hypothetical protein
MSKTVKLTKPIQAHSQTLTELTLREPKGRDIASCGLPRGFSQRRRALSMDVDTDAVHGYISTLGNIPPSSVDQLDAADWMTLMGEVLDFFAPAAPADRTTAAAATEEALPTVGIAIPFQNTTT